MKIAFTGASGTGKTSVAHHLLSPQFQTLMEVPLAGVDSRNLLDMLGLRRSESIEDDQYKVFQTMYFAQKVLIESEHEAFLTERSFVDGLVYWKMHCENNASPSENAIMHSLCYEQTMKYDYHFLFPTGFIPVEDDGYRHRDPEYHKKFELLLQSILREWEVRYTVIPRSDVSSRANFIMECLG